MCRTVGSMGRTTTKDVRTLALAFLLVHVTCADGQPSCPAGMYAAWGRNWCCSSKCGPGTRIAESCTYGHLDNTLCEDCGPEYYNPYPDQLHCRRKDLCNRENEEVKAPGNSTVDNQCQCQIGFFYKVSEVCMRGPVCPPGAGATRSGTCETCPHGTFSNITSHVQPCIPWQSCGLFGFLQHRPGTSTSDAVCISHPINVLLPTPGTEIDAVTYKDDVNSTNYASTPDGGQPTDLSVIIGICVSVPVLVLVVILVLCFCIKPRKAIVLEDGQPCESKTPLGVEEEEVINVNCKDGGLLGSEYQLLNGGAEQNSDVEETDPKLGLSTMQYSNLIGDNAGTKTTVAGDNNIYVTAGDNAVININQDPR
ncbi:uncharacterized protein LOC144911086 [Branchiostoma floridae x Branchiostoma belcheri]